MLRQIRPELGDKQKSEILAIYRPISRNFKLYTDIQLKGQGIKCDDAIGNCNHLNKPSYIVTLKAFERLCKKYNIDQELLLD